MSYRKDGTTIKPVGGKNKWRISEKTGKINRNGCEAKVSARVSGKNPEKFASFFRVLSGPHFLIFKLFNIFINLRSKMINKKVLREGKVWGWGKWGAV